MATRSTIALEFADDTVQQVYCNWDGYIDYNGKILQEHYSDPFKLRDLIDLGYISSLGPEIGEKHSFDNPYKFGTDAYFAEQNIRKNFTTFYGRDRGETGVEARRYKNYEDYLKNARFQEYNYILRRDGKWYVEYQEFQGLLTEAINLRERAEQ
jgi:hypothetical protein